MKARRTRSKKPKTLPRIAPRTAAEIPREPFAVGEGSGELEVTLLWVEVILEEDESDGEEKLVIEGIDEDEREGVAVAVRVGVGVGGVEGGEVRPPYVHAPSVPSGIYERCVSIKLKQYRYRCPKAEVA